MSIQLTPQQQQALDIQETGLPRIIDPRTNTAYVLIREADYTAIQELLRKRSVSRRSMRWPYVTPPVV